MVGIGTPQTKEEPEIKNVEKKRFLCLYLVGDSSLNSFPPEYSSCNVSFKYSFTIVNPQPSVQTVMSYSPTCIDVGTGQFPYLHYHSWITDQGYREGTVSRINRDGVI